jgi:hypothetical protein
MLAGKLFSQAGQRVKPLRASYRSLFAREISAGGDDEWNPCEENST